MSPEQTRAVEVKAAADNAMLKGLAKIEAAATGASDPYITALEKLDGKDITKQAQMAFGAVEKNQTDSLKQELGVEMARQEKAMADMEAGAEYSAEVSAQHIRETAEQWAENQAKNYIVLSANGTMANAMMTAQQTAMIRQEATELAKGAIKSAAQSLQVAKEAQKAIDQVPKASMDKARVAADKMKTEQKALNGDIEHVEGTARKVAKVAFENHNVAMRVLEEADVAEKRAREALETARGNSKKIAKLKERIQAMNSKAAGK